MAIQELAIQAGDFDRVGAGFPGVVKNGVIKTAPHLHKKWEGVRLDVELQKLLKKPARVANDAVVQGYPAITGRGIELGSRSAHRWGQRSTPMAMLSPWRWDITRSSWTRV